MASLRRRGWSRSAEEAGYEHSNGGFYEPSPTPSPTPSVRRFSDRPGRHFLAIGDRSSHRDRFSAIEPKQHRNRMPQTKPSKPFVPIPDPEQPTFPRRVFRRARGRGRQCAAQAAAQAPAAGAGRGNCSAPPSRPSSTSRRRGPRSFGGSLRTSCCRRPPRSSTARSKAPPSSMPTLGAAGRTVAATRRQRCSLCPTSRAHRQRPVVLFNQSLGDAGSLEPRLPQQVTLCEPQAGRLLVYRADELRAGTLQSDQPRLLIKLWQQPPQPSLPSAADAVIEGLLRHVRAEAPPLLEAARQWPVAAVATLPVSSSFPRTSRLGSRKLPLRVATHGGRAKLAVAVQRAGGPPRDLARALARRVRRRRSPAVRSRSGPIPPGWATLNSDRTLIFSLLFSVITHPPSLHAHTTWLSWCSALPRSVR